MGQSELERLKVDELKTLAEEKGVVLSSKMKKDEIITAILKSEEPEPAEDAATEEEAGPAEEPEKQEEPEPAENAATEEEAGPAEEPEKQEEPEPAEEYDDKEKIKLTYVGPTLPDGLLTNGKMLWGTMKSIMDYVEPEVRRYPKVKAMLVRQENASKARNDIRSGRGIYYKYYCDLVDEVKKGRTKK